MASSTRFTEGMRRVVNSDSSSSVDLDDFSPLHGDSRPKVSPTAGAAMHGDSRPRVLPTEAFPHGSAADSGLGGSSVGSSAGAASLFPVGVRCSHLS